MPELLPLVAPEWGRVRRALFVQIMSVGEEPEKVERDFDCANDFNSDGNWMRYRRNPADGESEVEVDKAC